MARVLVTRPQPLAGETAARLASLGHDVVIAPLLDPAPLDWTPPGTPVEALIFTSAQAPRLAGPAADRYQSLPVYAVGERTAAAARKAGFTQVETIGGDLATLLPAVAARHGRVLHLAGADRTEVPLPAGLEIVVRPVYEAQLAPLTAEAEAALRLSQLDWALLFSTRSAAHFAAMHDAIGVPRSRLSVAAISARTLAAAGGGWARAVAAAAPTEAGILAASGLSCDKSGPAAEELTR